MKLRIIDAYSRGKLSYLLILILLLISWIETISSKAAGDAVRDKLLFVIESSGVGIIVGLIMASGIRVLSKKISVLLYVTGFHFFMFPMFVFSVFNVLTYYILRVKYGIDWQYSILTTSILLGVRLLYK